MYGYVHEEVDICMNVSRRHATGRQSRQKIVTTGACIFDAVAKLVDVTAACTTNGIVPPDRVFHDGHEDFGYIRIKPKPRRYVYRTVQFDRISIVVSNLSISQVKNQKVDRLLPTDINYPQVCTFGFSET